MNNSGVTLMIDSGVGGLSVLALARKKLPEENFCFYADAANAPYGDKQPDEIRTILKNIIQQYSDRNLKAVLLACNTATSAAAALLRGEMPIPVIGMEPALKPAVLGSEGEVIVIATRLTIREKKFRDLLVQYGQGRDIVPIACSGLMEIVEKDPSGREASDYLENLLRPYEKKMESIVLGCTHYVFLRPLIQKMYPGLKIFDGNDGVTRHLGNVLKKFDSLGGTGEMEVDCSIRGTEEKQAYLAKCREMLRFCEQIYI